MRKAILIVVLLAPFPAVSGQVASRADLSSVELKLIDMEARLRVLEQEKVQREQAERDAEHQRQYQAQTQRVTDCVAYRRRVAAAKGGVPSPGQAMIDQMDKFACDRLDKSQPK